MAAEYADAQDAENHRRSRVAYAAKGKVDDDIRYSGIGYDMIHWHYDAPRQSPYWLRKCGRGLGICFAISTAFAVLAAMTILVRSVGHHHVLGFFAQKSLSSSTSPPHFPPEDWLRKWRAGNLVFSTGATLEQALMPNLGNGFMGFQLGSKWMSVNGLFHGPFSYRLHVPSPVYGIYPQGWKLEGTALDIEEGIAKQLFTASDGAKVVQQTYVHQSMKHVIMTELLVDNRPNTKNITIHMADKFAAELDGLVAHPVGLFFSDVLFRTALRNETLICLEAFPKATTGATDNTRAIFAYCRANARRAYSLPAGRQLHVPLLAVLWTGRECRPTQSASDCPLGAAMTEYAAVSSSHAQTIYQQHHTGMRHLWRSGIEVEGNITMAKEVNTSWWNLLHSFRADEPWSISPGGLGSSCYYGKVFWDAEEFVWHNLLMFHPALAETALMYRFNRKDDAVQNAAMDGYAGLKFPWESTASGKESCHSGVCGETSEIHVNGDVSFTFWQYWLATGDKHWLKATGWPILRGVAQYWASRADRLGDGQFAIKDVTDVDEMKHGVTNSGYTNAVAKLALKHAKAAAQILEVPSQVGDNWTVLAEQLPLPLDPTGHHHIEHDGATWGSGLGLIMMQYPLNIPDHWPDGGDGVWRNDLTLYEHYWPKGNALMWWVFAIAWLRLGDRAMADRYLHRVTQGFAYGPFKIWSEVRGGKGCRNFVTGVGAYLQIFWAGYGGIRLSADSLTFHHPTVPIGATGLRFRALAYHQNLVDVHITETSISLNLNLDSPETAPPLIAFQSGSSSNHLLRKGPAIVFASSGSVVLRVDDAIVST